MDKKLKWDDRLGIGYYPVRLSAETYGQPYWEKYVGYRKNSIGQALMDARVELVEKHIGSGPLVDIGIGSGHFIDTRRASTYGYDVNPLAIKWLVERDLWWDPYFMDPPAASCWDSLEHMSRPDEFLGRVSDIVFVSIPIFSGLDHVLRSKHYKPDEHFWYFTRHGFVEWMRGHGFGFVEESSLETDVGREDIGTFVFKRVASQNKNTDWFDLR